VNGIDEAEAGTELVPPTTAQQIAAATAART
jgi:hypothetical protein